MYLEKVTLTIRKILTFNSIIIKELRISPFGKNYLVLINKKNVDMRLLRRFDNFEELHKNLWWISREIESLLNLYTRSLFRVRPTKVQ